MRPKGSEPEITACAGTPRADAAPRTPRRLLRRRTLAQLLAEIEGTRKLRDECVRASELRHAGELSEELERLTREYVARRDAPVVVPPFYEAPL